MTQSELSCKLPKFWGAGQSILTFNYDMALDHACHLKGLRIDYGLERSAPSIETMKVLKLHGSLNWMVCSACEKVVAWKLEDYFKIRGWDFLHETRSVRLKISQNLSQYAHCQDRCSSTATPYLVPPTWNKSEHHHAIETVWRNAAAELAGAENIFIIGYSLPDTDSFFQYLFSLGVSSESLIRRFWVVDPDPKVENKYRRLVGQAIESRFQFFNYTFSEGIQRMRGAL